MPTIVKQLGGVGSPVATFNPDTGVMDIVQGDKKLLTLEAWQLKALLSHLYDLRDDIYEASNRDYEATHKQFHKFYDKKGNQLS